MASQKMSIPAILLNDNNQENFCYNSAEGSFIFAPTNN